ncbi:hypothetical protein BD779DRAFT_1661235 [Infundibulicybe gibba]|nr:hypothetical protein BD779DRAFT_1661235 [Infundibulicybe gibba]
MLSPSPLQSFLGGLGMPLPVHALLLLNGRVFGISGFMHDSIRGNSESICAVAGLISGGIFVGRLEQSGPTPLPTGLPQLLFSGILVGVGSKLSKGCTSGIAQSKPAAPIYLIVSSSIAATAAFCLTGVVTARVFHSDLPPSGPPTWSLGDIDRQLITYQAIPFSVSMMLYLFARLFPRPKESRPYALLRLITSFSTGLGFAFALRLSNLCDPFRVLSFLLLPLHQAFDPSLLYLAAGALPLSVALYHYARGPDYPQLGGTWAVPKPCAVDARLLAGAALFGTGWGIAGVCPGPGLVNLGRSLSGGSGFTPNFVWVAAVTAAGLLV